MLKSHSHPFSYGYGDRGYSGSGAVVPFFKYRTENTSSTGGNENRPKNACVNYIIKY